MVAAVWSRPSLRTTNMRIEFQRFGGLSPALMNRASRFSAELSPEEEAEVRSLLPKNFRQIPGSPPPGRAPSAFRYEIVIDDDGDRHGLTVSESDVPDSLRPFLSWVSAKA